MSNGQSEMIDVKSSEGQSPLGPVYSAQETYTIITNETRAALGMYRKLLAVFSVLIILMLVVVIALSIKIADDVQTCSEFPNQQQTFSDILSELRQPHLANTWQEIFPTGPTPPPRLAHAATALGTKMYIHGGMHGFSNETLGDMWSYDEATDAWELIRPTGDVPPPRLHHSFTDIDDRTILMFGGFNYFNTVPEHAGLSDMYSFDVVTKVWTRLDTKITGARPGARGAHEAVWHNGALYLFGGFPTIGATGHSAELWKYTVAANKWGLLNPPTTPSGRIGFSWVVVGNSAYLYGGGCEESGQCNDNWRFDFNSNNWAQLTPTVSPPHRRASHADVAVNGIVYLFGGVHIGVANGSPVVTMLNDLWAYDVLNNRWLEMVPNFGRGNTPPNVFGHSVVRINNRVVVFGGRIGAPNSPGSSMLWEYHTMSPQ